MTDKPEEQTQTPQVPEEPKEAEVKPTPSRSNTTKRLSMFLNKAKKQFSDKHPKEEHVVSKEVVDEPAPVEASASEAPKVEEPKAEEPKAEEPKAEEKKAEDKKAEDKKEKRRSLFLNGLFNRSKSPEPKEEPVATPEVPKEHKVEAAKEEKVDAPKEEAPKPEATQDAPAESSEPKEAVHKDNVIDQIKRHSIVNKFFGKKEDKNSQSSDEAETPAPEPAAPVVETKPEEDKEPAASSSRPSSPLGRRLTKILRFPTKKDKKEKAPAAAEEAKEEEAKKEEPKQDEDVIVAPLPPAANPAVQATA